MEKRTAKKQEKSNNKKEKSKTNNGIDNEAQMDTTEILDV